MVPSIGVLTNLAATEWFRILVRIQARLVIIVMVQPMLIAMIYITEARNSVVERWLPTVSVSSEWSLSVLFFFLLRDGRIAPPPRLLSVC